MAGDVKIKFLSTENLPAFGEILHRAFLKEAKELYDVSKDYEKPDVWNKVKAAISTVYEKAGLAKYEDIKEGYTERLRIGDIVLLEDDKRAYAVTGISNDNVRTYPRPIARDVDSLKPSKIGGRSGRVKRPNLSQIKSESYENIVLENLPDEIINREAKNTATFKAISLSDDSTHLQIGDLILGVDPIQLSFTTQNGYQYFPTLRTSGNPKLPTMQQIKNITIVLMFPNVDAINYQLIPLYAMFRRTPFVNIKNRDLLRFFKDVASPTGYIPVALESIQIQSIDGFPNSLQATISVLPFDPGPTSNGSLQALKSFDDVFIQQESLSKDIILNKMIETADLKMQDISSLPTTFDSLTQIVSEASENFKESFPFRAFYQSLIAGRKSVLNENGEEAKLYNSDDSSALLASDISFLSPRNRENFLHEYNIEANRKQVGFKYTYVTLFDKDKKETPNLADIGKYFSDERIDSRDKRLDSFRKLFDAIGSYEGLANTMFSAFHNMSDAFRPIEYEFSKMDNLVNHVLALHGVDPKMVVKGTPSTGAGFLTNLGKLMSFLTRSTMQQVGVAPIASAIEAINKNIVADGKIDYNKAAADQWALLKKAGLLYNEANTGELSKYGIHTLDGAFQALWAWIEEDKSGKRKQDFIVVLQDIMNALKGDLSTSIMVVNAGQSVDESEYKIVRLPVKTVEFYIDNKTDVITSWSLVYSNKFVPINLLAYKYPFYQHLGSDDPTLSLSITSVPNGERFDLKEQLALLSDRMYDSVKLVNYTSPDLYTWMDPRVELDYAPGHIFHCFGIHKVVLNSSNSTNIQGQPDAWNTTINLTQANFSLEQYHSISSANNLTEIDAIISQLIPRLRIDESGNLTVLALKHPTETLTLDEVVYLSFLFSTPGQRYVEHVDQMIKTYGKLENSKKVTGKDLINLLAPKMKLYYSMDPNQIDKGATKKLEALCLENKKFKGLITAIAKEYEQLLEVQADAFINIIDREKSIFEQVVKGIRDSKNVIAGAAIGAAGLDYTLLFLLSLGPAGPWAAAVGVGLIATGALLYTGVNIGAELARNKVKKDLSALVANIINVYKKEILLELSRAIVKDPPIRRRLLSKEFISLLRPPTVDGDQVDIEKYISQVQYQKRLNCYPDFDMPVIWESADRIYKASPDFYLYNFSNPQTYINTYVKESTDRLIKIGKMGMQLALVEHKNLYESLEQLTTQVSSQGDKNIQNVLSGVYTEIGYANSADSFLNLAQMYRLVAFKDENIKTSDVSTEQDTTFLTEQRKEELIKEHESVNSELKKTNPKLFEYEQTILNYMLSMDIAPKIQDTNIIKYNIVWTARMKTLIELIALGYQIQTYFASETALKGSISVADSSAKKDLNKYVEQEKKKQQLSGQILEKLVSLKADVWAILENWKDATSKTVNSTTDTRFKTLKKKYNKGFFAETINDSSKEESSDFLQVPSIRNLEAEVYNKIGFFIRLNTVIELANGGNSVLKPYSGNVPNLSLDSLPELGFIDAFNVRQTESVFRALEIERQLFDSMQKNKNVTLKYFPTFKIFFIEEESKRYQVLDDYYAYNAVQSIEISKNKHSSSVVAVIRLNNLNGTITDKLSFHRERSDFMQANDFLNEDDAFFGTLDVKPGTKVQIKLGYAANDSDLPTVFTGRILEMNAGPVTEIICQSYGAQLNHKVLQTNVGFFSSEKEYGDIASALLDIIPGLENLGKKEIASFGLLSGFTGRDLKKIRTSLFDNFLLSTVLGRLTANLRGFDNPRDENIYLPFNLSIYPKWKPRFDWVVYNQSVWDSVKELCLYCNNTEAVIKQYNNDPLSQRGEQRETIVIGNKSGYYKWTDSLALSSIDTDDIDNRIAKFKDILSKDGIKNPQFTTAGKQYKLKGIQTLREDKYRLLSPLKFVYDNVKTTFLPKGINKPIGSEVKYANLKPEFLPLWEWLSDPLNSNIIKKRLLNELDLTIKTVSNFASEAFKRQFKSFADPISSIIDSLDKFSSSSIVRDPIKGNVATSQKGEYFPTIVFFISAIEGIEGKSNFWDLCPEDFYSVKAAVDNLNPALSSDIRYRKIQQHHLVSESINLISNDISLNANFPNKINLFYFDEPQFISSIDGVQPDKFKKINMWPIRSFGDIKDEHIRELNVFQKNIDPYWLDIKESTEGFFKGYRRLMVKAAGKNKKKGDTGADKVDKYIESINKDFGTFNINTPDWRAFPSYQIVGVNILKKEVSKMYRGTIQIVGDPEIEPLDIVHIQDYINDMHGAVEVEEVVHTFTPDRGFITTITPCLITYDRDPIQLEDVSVINRIYDVAQAHSKATVYKVIGGAAGAIAGTGMLLSGNPTTMSAAVGVGGLGLLSSLSGLSAIFGNKYHRFLYDSLGNILGRDVINFTALLYHGLPFMCGFDGVDYTNLKTLMTHKADNVEGGIISRLSVFSDEFAACIYTNFTPGNFTLRDAVVNKLGFLKYFTNLPSAGQLKDGFSFGDRYLPWNRLIGSIR